MFMLTVFLMCPVSTGSASGTPLPRKLLGQALHQDSFAAGTEEDMGLGSGQSPRVGTDPHESPGRCPLPSDGAQPPLSPIPVRLMTAVTVMRTAQEGDTLRRCSSPQRESMYSPLCRSTPTDHGTRVHFLIKGTCAIQTVLFTSQVLSS